MRLFLRRGTRELIKRLQEPPRLPQILLGPRQVGKTTAISQAIAALRRKGFSAVSATADAPASPNHGWITDHWRKAEAISRTGRPTILAFDELQKIPGWSEVVKREFDSSQRVAPAQRPRIVISGSSALLVERGLTESLAGRFELIRFPHWGLEEESAAFGLAWKEHVSLGGYPRLREFLPDERRFLAYVRDSIVESVLNKDLLLLHPVEKPVLLRRLFEFSCRHPAEIVSLQKMLGQLTDTGNVTTLSHYLDLLSKAFLIAPLQKYSPEILRIRASSPKLIVLAPALVAALQDKTSAEASSEPEVFGRWAENAVGAHLLRAGLEVFYWRDRDLELDFIAKQGTRAIAFEVSTSDRKPGVEALDRLARKCGASKAVLVGPSGVRLDEFFRTDPLAWFGPGRP